MEAHTNIIIGHEQRVLGRLLGRQMGSEWEAEEVGEWIGPYQLVERLGEGGFGIVWRAQQTAPVEREVGLKVIKRGMDTAQVLARFTHERQALAGMDHPGIAAMLDAGASVDGRPYFAMELVKGISITQWCESRRLPIHERLRLFSLVCNAVQHAHQKGIIHRDLKPSNILITSVDSLTLPKIIDFGIAKAIRQSTNNNLSMLTFQDQVIGTPLYMSPEQLEGGEDIDTRSDIYALGVLLYELLTGTQPFDSATLKSEGLEGIKRRIRDVPPERPSAMMRKRRRLDGDLPPVSPPIESSLPNFSSDLDWITMCALEKEPARRYQSAAEFAADIKRFMQREPVLARPPHFGYVASRWIQRHRSVFVAACLIVFAMIAGTTVALWQAQIARAAERSALAETARATRAEHTAVIESTRAQQNAAFLTSLLERVTTEVKNGRNPEALSFALADSAERIGALSDDHALRLGLLEQVAAIYADIGETKLVLPLLKMRSDETAAVHGPNSDKARTAELEYIKEVADHGARITAPELLENLKQRAEAHGERGTKFWFDVQRQIIRAWVKLKQAGPAQTAADEILAEAKARDYKSRSLLSIQIACIPPLELAHEYDRAEALVTECRATAEQLREDSRLKELDSIFLHILWSKEDYSRAAEFLRGIVAHLKIEHGEQSVEVLPRLIELVEFEREARQFRQASDHSREVISISRQHDHHRTDLIQGLLGLARSLSDDGQSTDAITHAEEALSLAKEVGKDTGILKSLETLAVCHRDANQLDAAANYFELHRQQVEAAHANYKDVSEDLEDIATIRIAQGRTEDAMKLGLAMWGLIESEPTSKDDPGYRKHVAKQALSYYNAYRTARPEATAPAALAAWEAAANNSATAKPGSRDRLWIRGKVK